MIVRGIRFMPRLEVKDFARSPVVSTSAAEHFSSLEPADEDQVVGFGNIKKLAVHFFILQLNILTDACSDRMGRIDNS
jgi:hypothetical protein